jgi:hypothetical protein
MPEVARGTASWSRDDADHLARCTSCQDEWELARAAATHGLALGMRVDAGRLAEVVERRLERLPEARLASRTGWWAGWPMALAAGILLLVWAGPRPRSPGEAAPEVTVTVLHELDDLSDSELEAMLDVVEDPAAVNYRPLDTPESLGDLSEAELQLLLDSMED